MKKGMVIAIDFDGTLCENEFPAIGPPKKPVIKMCRQTKEWGNKLILWTCREGDLLTEAIDWCREQGIEFDAVNAPLPEQLAEFKNDTRKIYADVYIDDRAYSPETYATTVEFIKRKLYIDTHKCDHCQHPQVCDTVFCRFAEMAAGEAYRREQI